MVNLYDEITFPHPQLTKYNNVSHNTQECNSIWHRPRIWYLASMWNRLFWKFCTEEMWTGMQVIFPNVLNPILDVDLFRKDLFIFKINLIYFHYYIVRELCWGKIYPLYLTECPYFKTFLLNNTSYPN